MKHVVSISDLSKKQILSILKRAKELVPVAQGKKKSKSLDGKILATCFFEPPPPPVGPRSASISVFQPARDSSETPFGDGTSPSDSMAAETLGTAVVSPPTDGITSLHFGGDDDLLLATSWDGGVRLYRAEPDARTSALVHDFPGPAPVLDGCFADGGGAAVASAGLGRTVTRHDLTTGAEAAVGAHDDAVKCVAWDFETGCQIAQVFCLDP